MRISLFLAFSISLFALDLPLILPPHSQQSEQSTNLLALFYSGNQTYLNRDLEKVFKKLDTNNDQQLTMQDFKQLSEKNDTDSKEISNFLKDNAFSNLDQDHNQSINQNEFVSAFDQVFDRNFTLLPALCKEVQQRLELCQIDLQQNFTDPYTGQIGPLQYVARKENLKCQSGISGIENDFDVAKCVVTSPCSQILSCYQKTESRNLDLLKIGNMHLSQSLSVLTKNPNYDQEFQKFEYSTETEMTIFQNAEVFLESGFMALLCYLVTLIMDNLKTELAPKIETGARFLVKQGVEKLLPFFTQPEFLLAIGAVLVVSIAVWILPSLFRMIKELWFPSAKNDLYMEYWNPYNFELEPKCEWSVYMTKNCFNGNSIEKKQLICDKGGELYRERECDSTQWKFFYQQFCPIRRCRQLCQVANFECGHDGYTYRNLTEWLYQPTQKINSVMFTSSYAQKPFVLLDQRHVYQMAQCRDTCDRYTKDKQGYSGCIGFMVRGPDPLLDPRPAFTSRLTCFLFALRENEQTATEEGWPKLIQTNDDIFGYAVTKQNTYPPLVVGFQEKNI